MKKKFNFFTWLLDKREISLGLLVLLMAIILSVTTDSFLTSENIFNIFKQASITVVLACGMTFIISGGGIDLSIANNMALTSIVLCLAYNATNSSIVALLTAIVVGVGIGTMNGTMITKLGLPAFIVTMGVSNVCSGLALVITRGYPIQFNSDAWMYTLGQEKLFGIPNLIYTIPVFTVVGQFVLRKTVLGNRLQACGGNSVAAQLSGLNVSNLKILTYAIGGLFAGLAGFLMAGRLNAGNASCAGTLGMDAICAAVVGGTSMAGGGGTVVGAMIGALLMQMIKNSLIQYEVNTYWQTAVIGIVLVGVCTLDLISRKAGEKGSK